MMGDYRSNSDIGHLPACLAYELCSPQSLMR